MAFTFSVTNQKGGVGKTTTTAALAVALAKVGYDVLAVDLDPQGHLSMLLGVEPVEDTATTYEVLMQAGSIEASIRDTRHEKLKVIPAKRDLEAAESLLLRMKDSQGTLRRALTGVGSRYSFVVIDTPPSLGMLTVNALTASDGVLVPVDSSFLGTRGLGDFLKVFRQVRERLNPGLQHMGIALTFYQQRTRHSRELEQKLREGFGSIVMKTVIPYSVYVRDASAAGYSPVEMESDHPTSVAYLTLAQEVEQWTKEARESNQSLVSQA